MKTYFESLHLRLGNLYSDYCEDCRPFNLSLNKNKSSFKSLNKEVETSYKKLYEDKGYDSDNIDSHKPLVNATYGVYKEALDQGIKDNVIPGRMRESLENDIFVFSALKTHAQLNEASRLLVDEKGQIKSFRKFSKDVKSLKSNYNENYLEAEYNFALSSSQSAAKWAEFEKEGDRYNLQYRTAMDDKVRDSHEALHNITLPPSDGFWSNYFPPNGWRCRCNAVQVRKSKYPESNSGDAMAKGDQATSQVGKDGKNRLEIFRFNPGKEKVAFPPNHPYNKVIGASAVSGKTNELKFQEVYKSKRGGKVYKHNKVSAKDPDYDQVYDSAKHFANQGDEAQIMPRFNATGKSKSYKETFNELEGTAYYGKCPDLRVKKKDGSVEFYEHEGFKTKNSKNAVKNMINRGLKQSSRIIIEDTGISRRYLMNNILARVKQGQKIDEVYLKKGSNLELFYKKTEAQ
jgi:SPP1 gp7 family putative phage head morphogenesis protein